MEIGNDESSLPLCIASVILFPREHSFIDLALLVDVSTPTILSVRKLT